MSLWDSAVLVLDMNTLVEACNKEHTFQDSESVVTRPAHTQYDQLSFPANFLRNNLQKYKNVIQIPPPLHPECLFYISRALSKNKGLYQQKFQIKAKAVNLRAWCDPSTRVCSIPTG